MERSLDPKFLAIALGEHESLPTSAELAKLLAEAELAILLHSPVFSEQMDAVGWYLHAIASSKFALKAFGIERQRTAFQVAGHIFDLKLHMPEISEFEKLKYCFASQIAYARSTLDPNAIAIYKREFPNGPGELQFILDFQQVALSCGIAFLGYDVKYIFQTTKKFKAEIDALVSLWQVDSITSTVFGAISNLVLGIRDLMSFLVYGRKELLQRSREYLQIAVTNDASLEDDISRWVAAHLLNYSEKLERSSIWTVLPPDIPDEVRKAFVNGNPPILTLWPPQIEFLGNGQEENSPLSENVKRLILSTPTSGGKTLIAQLLVVAHLATKASSVCYVAPTRSLCREVRDSLQARLRFLGSQVIDGLPEGGCYDQIFDEMQPQVEVMTPERLSYLIRTNKEKLLDQYGMFIFDEVHLVGDQGRGWTLEEDLSFLHYATEYSHHRIILMSAVLGNRNHFVQWITGDNGKQIPFAFHRDWKGPRRIHAIWTTEPQWEYANVEDVPSGRRYLYRETTPLFGRLDARITHTGEINTLYTSEAIGQLVRKGETKREFHEKDGNWQKDRDLSTPFYKMLVPIIEYLGEAGSVLVIEASKIKTIRLAKELADRQQEVKYPEIIRLRDLIIARLGPNHPLAKVVVKGVAYHHGSLPNEIRSAIESVVASGQMKFLVATTTLTEGVNLPVTSVIIASQGNYNDEGLNEFITGSKLINAIGRAGRATKETEGIVVLARQNQPTEEDFDRLSPDESNLHVTSMLATNSALDELALFEEIKNSSQDAVFQIGGQIADFLKFVWFIASELEKMGREINIEHIEEALQHTLGWGQLSQLDQSRWLSATNVLIGKYNQTPQNTRLRWSSSGTSLASASQLEDIVKGILGDLNRREPPQDILGAVEFLVSNGRLEKILGLPESPKRRIFTSRGSGRKEIPIHISDLLKKWIQGASLLDLCDIFADVADIGFRFEQLGDFIYEYFEVYLPWIIGTVINWTNTQLIENGRSDVFPTTIPANIRYGVGNDTALNLMIRGIQSRSLAKRISEVWSLGVQGLDVMSWIGSLTLSQWTDFFKPSPSEVRNLLEVVRPQNGGVAVKLFKYGETVLSVKSEFNEYPRTSVNIALIEMSDLSSLGIWDGDSLIGKIYSQDQSDIEYLLKLGFLDVIEFSSSSGIGKLSLKFFEIE